MGIPVPRNVKEERNFISTCFTANAEAGDAGQFPGLPGRFCPDVGEPAKSAGNKVDLIEVS